MRPMTQRKSQYNGRSNKNEQPSMRAGERAVAHVFRVHVAVYPHERSVSRNAHAQSRCEALGQIDFFLRAFVPP